MLRERCAHSSSPYADIISSLSDGYRPLTHAASAPVSLVADSGGSLQDDLGYFESTLAEADWLSAVVLKRVEI